MLTKEAKKQILISLLETIGWIASKEYQRRAWIRGEGPNGTDFDETCNFFFDDADGIIDKYQEFELTESQYEILKDFRDQFNVFKKNNYWPPEFIETPEWDRIVELANNVLKAFKDQKS